MAIEFDMRGWGPKDYSAGFATLGGEEPVPERPCYAANLPECIIVLMQEATSDGSLDGDFYPRSALPPYALARFR